MTRKPLRRKPQTSLHRLRQVERHRRRSRGRPSRLCSLWNCRRLPHDHHLGQYRKFVLLCHHHLANVGKNHPRNNPSKTMQNHQQINPRRRLLLHLKLQFLHTTLFLHTTHPSNLFQCPDLRRQSQPWHLLHLNLLKKNLMPDIFLIVATLG